MAILIVFILRISRDGRHRRARRNSCLPWVEVHAL